MTSRITKIKFLAFSLAIIFATGHVHASEVSGTLSADGNPSVSSGQSIQGQIAGNVTTPGAASALDSSGGSSNSRSGGRSGGGQIAIVSPSNDVGTPVGFGDFGSLNIVDAANQSPYIPSDSQLTYNSGVTNESDLVAQSDNQDTDAAPALPDAGNLAAVGGLSGISGFTWFMIALSVVLLGLILYGFGKMSISKREP